MKNAKTEEDKARMKDRWLQIDAEQNEEWLRKQGTGAYIDLSTIKKGDMPRQVIIEKRNGYKEALKKESIGDGNGHSSGKGTEHQFGCTRVPRNGNAECSAKVCL